MAALVMKMELVTPRFSINISAKMREILYIGSGENDARVEDVQLKGQAMKTVKEFTYLGSVIAINGEFTQDTEMRRTGATRAFGMLRRRLWGRREISLKVKTKIFNAVVLPVLFYCATAWALPKTWERRLDAFQIGMLGIITRVRWDNFIRNEVIRERFCQTPVS